MFLGNQSFPGSLGCNFAGSLIEIILIITGIKQVIVYRLVGM